MALAVLPLALAVGLGGLVGNTERVSGLWVSAEIAEDGSARITEVIDYDFGYGASSRHGIYRDIPDLAFDSRKADISTTEDGVPVTHELTRGDTSQTRITMGDPERANTGLRRYRLEYTLQDIARDGKLNWNAVGAGWKVDLDDIRIHVVAPYDLTGTRCVQGVTGSRQSCTAVEPEPGHLVVALDGLGAGGGVTLHSSGAVTGSVGGAAAPPAPPTGMPDGDALMNPLRSALLAAATALAGALVTARLLRLAGRDRRADALTPRAVPPEGLSPAQGGILLAERVEPRHQVAWLLGAAIDGHVRIFGEERYPTVRRTTRRDEHTDPATETVLGEMFAGRGEFDLGADDQRFRTAWHTLGDQLADWQRTSGLWDPAGERRSRTARRIGIAAAVLGLVVATAHSPLGGWTGWEGWPIVVAGAVVAGAGLALWLRAWELQGRTARGAALWGQAESFRRFMADPHPTDATALYTAWAVALGELAAWQRVVTASTTEPPAPATPYGPVLAVGLIAATAVSGAPLSSGDSVDSGGEGGGGGGGGSW
ncbi:DUF2207 domain-containing protein [Streptomyces sp. NPDC003042]